ncbi:ABC transporter permease [Longispora sp. NPDC051575]|uniref:ABC transporter permease n=1 Tax=Longispora sp. NPDC051575 TaxID=3154943 RepID=UPI00344134F3
MTALSLTVPRVSARLRGWRVRPGLVLGVAFLVLLVIAAIAPALLTSHDPLEISTDGAFLPPGGDHLLGTDQSGRDILARMVHGARSSLVMGLGATAIGVTVGAAVGLLAGLANRFVEGALMRLVDVTLSVPDLLMALVVIALLGTGTVNALFAVAFASIPYYARMLRAQTHVVRRATYVEAATALGLPRWTVIRRHVLPNAFKPLIVLATIGIGNAIGAGASLSFLGLGTKPPAPEWGNMLSLGIQYISNDWTMVAIPGLAITLTVLSVTVVGRDLKRRSEGRAV